MESGNSLDLARIFISYSSRGDGCKWRDALLECLHIFEQHNLLDAWYDERILASSNWHKAIEDAMSSARVAVLLLTPEALQTEYILEVEFPFLEKRWRNGELLVFSIICEPCSWEKHPWLKEVQAFCRATPLSKLSFEKQQLCFRQIAVDISTQLSNIVLADLPQPERLPASDQIFLQKFPLSRGPGLLEEKLIGREQELALLDLAFAQPDTAIASLVAWGGVGKTMLVQEWLKRLERKDWFGVQCIYGWSFYSQGTNEDRQASEDTFFAHALECFGVQCEPTVSPWEKGRLLAEAINSQKSILILDGVEPLQYPPGPMGGQFRAPGVQSLLKHLAWKGERERSALGSLCLVTTRELLSDLAEFQRREGSAWGSMLRVNLDNLTDEAGAQLLHHTGATQMGGTEIRSDNPELLAASQEVDGHALTLNLLGRFLARAHDGDPRRRDRVGFRVADLTIQGGTTFRMLSAFEDWFARGGDIGTRQLAVLRILGLFDRPADAACLEALRRPPILTGLTEPLFNSSPEIFGIGSKKDPVSDEDWNMAVSFLVDFDLVKKQSAADHSDSYLECHPLVREHFAERVRKKSLSSWRTAHERLYEHLKQSTDFRPSTLEGLEPLYHAVTHGCLSGKIEQTFLEVYYDRIMRGAGQSAHNWFSTMQLGAIQSDLVAAMSFFKEPWIEASSRLRRIFQVALLGDVGFSLRALGRFSEAIGPMKKCLERTVAMRHWTNAASAAANLSELQLSMGKISEAINTAEMSIGYAERSMRVISRLFVAPFFFRSLALGTAADALNQAGKVVASQDFFKKAELMQARHQPAFPLLSNILGFQYCELLLSAAERYAWLVTMDYGWPANNEACSACDHVTERYKEIFRWEKQTRVRFASLLGPALDQLPLARAKFYKTLCTAGLEGTGVTKLKVGLSEGNCRHTSITENAYQSISSHLKDAIEGIRASADVEFIPRGLLTRAWLRFVSGDRVGSWSDLDEAWSIAERGPMRLHMADIRLCRARLFFRENPYPWISPEDDLAAAEELINECSYHRRDQELADAKQIILISFDEVDKNSILKSLENPHVNLPDIPTGGAETAGYWWGRTMGPKVWAMQIFGTLTFGSLLYISGLSGFVVFAGTLLIGLVIWLKVMQEMKRSQTRALGEQVGSSQRWLGLTEDEHNSDNRKSRWYLVTTIRAFVLFTVILITQRFGLFEQLSIDQIVIIVCSLAILILIFSKPPD